METQQQAESQAIYSNYGFPDLGDSDPLEGAWIAFVTNEIAGYEEGNPDDAWSLTYFDTPDPGPQWSDIPPPKPAPQPGGLFDSTLAQVLYAQDSSNG